jgi:ATP-dependent helicase/nuclease subunit B
MHAHPLMRALWRPRLLKALEWIEAQIAADPARVPTVIEDWGRMDVRGVEIFGKADRIDRLPDGTLAIVDYKTGAPPSGREVEAGYALQLGTLGLMARAGAFAKVQGEPARFEYGRSAAARRARPGSAYIATPILEGRKQKGIRARGSSCRRRSSSSTTRSIAGSWARSRSRRGSIPTHRAMRLTTISCARRMLGRE